MTAPAEALPDMGGLEESYRPSRPSGPGFGGGGGPAMPERLIRPGWLRRKFGEGKREEEDYQAGSEEDRRQRKTAIKDARKWGWQNYLDEFQVYQKQQALNLDVAEEQALQQSKRDKKQADHDTKVQARDHDRELIDKDTAEAKSASQRAQAQLEQRFLEDSGVQDEILAQRKAELKRESARAKRRADLDARGEEAGVREKELVNEEKALTLNDRKDQIEFEKSLRAKTLEAVAGKDDEMLDRIENLTKYNVQVSMAREQTAQAQMTAEAQVKVADLNREAEMYKFQALMMRSEGLNGPGEGEDPGRGGPGNKPQNPGGDPSGGGVGEDMAQQFQRYLAANGASPDAVDPAIHRKGEPVDHTNRSATGRGFDVITDAAVHAGEKQRQ